MSTGSDPKVDQRLIEQARKQVNQLAAEIAQLSETDLGPGEYYGEFLQRLLAAMAAPAGAIWIRTPQGNLQLQYQIRMREVGLDAVEDGRKQHDELLRQVVMKGQPAMLAPQSGLGTPENGAIPAGNPTNFVCLIAPIMAEKQVAGMVEVWQDPNRGVDAQRGFLQFIIKMAGLASNYTRNQQLRQMSSQQQVWTQLETFTRQIHGSLNPTEVSYLIANEGRRLIECDRVSVGIREGGKAHVRAISGADIIEKRSNLVQLMRRLFDEVMIWNEKLVYNGTKDESLPPRVLRALDNYLAESNSKLLVVSPLRDEREKNPKNPPRSVLMMESFEPSMAPEQLVARMEVVAKHGTPALYNSSEYRRIPFGFLWRPLAHVQEGLGGKSKAILLAITFGLVLLIAAMVLVPYPLKMEAKGQLLPIERTWVFSPRPATVERLEFGVDTGKIVNANSPIMLMWSQDLAKEIAGLEEERDKAFNDMELYKEALTKDFLPNKADLQIQFHRADELFKQKNKQLADLKARLNAQDVEKAGQFWIKAPQTGMILTPNIKEKLTGRTVDPKEPLIRIGKVDPKNPKVDNWEIELKIPQKHVGQVLAAFENEKKRVEQIPEKDRKDWENPGDPELNVDLLLVSQPTATFKAKLKRSRVATEAIPDRTDNNEAEPVVLAYAYVTGPGIPTESQLPTNLLVTGTEVHARVRCGYHPMGYSLFYGVWEFIYENIVWFF